MRRLKQKQIRLCVKKLQSWIWALMSLFKRNKNKYNQDKYKQRYSIKQSEWASLRDKQTYNITCYPNACLNKRVFSFFF